MAVPRLCGRTSDSSARGALHRRMLQVPVFSCGVRRVPFRTMMMLLRRPIRAPAALRCSRLVSTATRTESDAFGPIEVPDDALWGAQTQVESAPACRWAPTPWPAAARSPPLASLPSPCLPPPLSRPPRRIAKTPGRRCRDQRRDAAPGERRDPRDRGVLPA